MNLLRLIFKPDPRASQIPAEAASLQRHSAELRQAVREAQEVLRGRGRLQGGGGRQA